MQIYRRRRFTRRLRSQTKGSEAKGRQTPIHTANHPAKIGNTVLDELKAEIEDDDS